MGKRLGALRRQFVHRSALITSWASVVIALAALGLTIYSGAMDRKYRELSIQPELTADVQADDFHFDVWNSGLGPARIKRVAFRANASCVYLEKAERPDERLVTEIIHGIGDHFAEPFKPYIQGSIWEPVAPRVRVQTPIPGEIIAAGEHITLFRFEQHQLESLRERMAKSSTDISNEMVQKFLHLALTLPLYVEYCSLTDYYCPTANGIQERCK